jgi:GTP-binding protein HflX
MSRPQPRARQRALCIAALPDGGEQEALGELGELLRTAGVAVAGELVQHRQSPHPDTYLGRGKLSEAAEAAKRCDANVIACDDELSPRQERNLERELGLPVVDRTAVILDIFAAHASSAEGKLQVELAQLEYNLARMRGLWSHLERLGGGIGTRGPGESQIETDRRLARDRISALRKRLEQVKRSRAVMRAERERAALPQIALVGYTNVGKSTLLNALAARLPRGGATVGRDGAQRGNGAGGAYDGAGAERDGLRRRDGVGAHDDVGARNGASAWSTAHAAVGDRLFHTLDPTTRTIWVGGRRQLLTDTVGFISKLPHQLVDAFGATLEETVKADLLLHVLDASAQEQRLQEMRLAVESTLEEIGAGETPRLIVCNKLDLLGEQEAEDLRLRHPEAVLVSGNSGVGLDLLAEAVERELRRNLRAVELLVPYSDGGRLAELHELAGELDRRDTPEGVHVRALLPERLAARFARFAVA